MQLILLSPCLTTPTRAFEGTDRVIYPWFGEHLGAFVHNGSNRVQDARTCRVKTATSSSAQHGHNIQVQQKLQKLLFAQAVHYRTWGLCIQRTLLVGLSSTPRSHQHTQSHAKTTTHAHKDTYFTAALCCHVWSHSESSVERHWNRGYSTDDGLDENKNTLEQL